ncbi:YciI family protein [Sulfitobacter aestuariivivens]|uniref:YciI family protein n=1 Tax=Sulfitobacter aestuariivivens TaxID=2766981 RepID=A0A927HDX3_9RHOB|nr:YciI family protein [Sulfitobacter aestuariivivens]MBD3664162.1 YciI family protein [Sulfitobacter aestuariivivens]
MHFVVHALDQPDALDRRLAVLDAHRRYLAEVNDRLEIKILLSGPLIEDGGDPMKGSFFLIDAPDRASVEALFESDPMAQADVWSDCHITALNLRVNNMGHP